MLASAEVARIAKSLGRTATQAVFRFAVQVGMIPLTGTRDPDHMAADLEVFDFILDPKDVGLIANLSVR